MEIKITKQLQQAVIVTKYNDTGLIENNLE